MFQRKCKIKPKKSPIRGIIGHGNINEEKIITLNEKEIIRCLNTGEVYDAETGERLTLKNYKNITKSSIRPVEKVVAKKENKSIQFQVSIKEEPKNITDSEIHNTDKVETTPIVEETEASNIEEVNTSTETQEEVVVNQNNNQPRYNNKKTRNKQRNNNNNYKKQNQ